ncbi:hypothetical protein [Streptomyces yaizuensis]|uniref:DUF4160 domain-containing protein n=1 Tax=Streptomyces yaizuensis TaxID=2989713 RepID=A0ABQ5NX67_9ACTN|nr:hypothetical protein [Streptomyces sp. YSPA8]GLF94837.1 DUF4160 domain-containing protein [Streptomyces sp. YSPA8]
MHAHRPVRARRLGGVMRSAIAATAAATAISLLVPVADAAAVQSRATEPRSAAGGQAAASQAPPGLPDLKWAPWPEWSIWTNFYNTGNNKDWSIWNAWTPSNATGEQEQADRCRLGTVLHRGGPLVKSLAQTALKGTPADRRAALTENTSGKTPVTLANDKDWATAPPPPGFDTEQQKRWLAQIGQFQHHSDAPEFDTETRKFRRDAGQRTQDAVFADLVPRAGKASIDRITALITEQQATDEYFKALDTFQKDLAKAVGGTPGKLTDITQGMSSDDARMFLQSGGFPKVAPEPGSMEFRTEVESLKARWANCDFKNPADPYRVLGQAVETARAEWQAELGGQATHRDTIVDAEAKAYNAMWDASFAMVEAVGQAWVAEQINVWQRSQGPTWVPTAAQKTKIQTEIKKTQTAIQTQVTRAKALATEAANQATRADTAQTAAAALAAAAGAPRGRGLAYAQQSVQVTKAAAAAALAASKSTDTALLASKATVADNGALFSRARAEAHALEAEYRRAAAEENARQAKAAADAAAAQTALAGKEAEKAKAARARAEKAEADAKAGAADARAKRLTAEQEKANAAAARRRAEDERAKAAAAEQRAAAERQAAADALGRANTAGAEADTKSARALQAERDATAARDRAVAAERDKNAKASRAAAYEAAAAAAEGTENAAAARAAATEARQAANDAAGAASRAHTAANQAQDAAVAARKAATEATAAADRSRAAADGAQAAAARTNAAAKTARAAAADAIDAAEAAASHTRAAEAFARAAAANARAAQANATAARAEAVKARAESAVTAGYAFAATQAAHAARDAAKHVIAPANAAISLGSPYQQVDASAGMAVLVGQSAKTLAEQQANAAQASAAAAAKEAQAAKDAAARADKDSKLAAEAASQAAAESARAAESVKQAHVFAAAAAADAKAAQTASTNADRYDREAQADATAADKAATSAEGEAAAARNAATEAELDAAKARQSANAAQSDANAADTVARYAEEAAVRAENAAKNAQAAAVEAEQAATRAEEEYRQRQEAARQARAEAAADTGPDLTADEESILLRICGQPCVDDWRAAKAASAQDVMDWVVANGGQIILDVVGWTDAKKCFTKGDVEACLWTLINAASLAVVITKLPQLTVAVGRVALGIGKFFETSAKAKRTIQKLRDLIDKARRDPDAPSCLRPPTRPARAAFAAAASSTPNDPCNLYRDLDDLPFEKLEDIEKRYGTEVADGVEYNWGKMQEKDADGFPTKNAKDHAIPGIGTNVEELAKYWAKWRGKETHIDPVTKHTVAYDDTKGVVIIILTGRNIHGYKMTHDKFLSKFLPLPPKP